MEIADLVESLGTEEHRFCVEAGHGPDNAIVVEWSFHDLSKAQIFTDECIKWYPCVWLSEWGAWTNQAGNRREGWVHLWWTDGCGFNVKPQKRGYGIVEGQQTLRNYEPLARPKE